MVRHIDTRYFSFNWVILYAFYFIFGKSANMRTKETFIIGKKMQNLMLISNPLKKCKQFNN